MNRKINIVVLLPTYIVRSCLTLLGFLPGHIHAFYILVTYASKPQQPYQQVPSGRTHRHQGANYQTYQPQPQPQPQQPTIVVPPVGDKKDYRGPSEVGSSNVNTQPYPQQKSNTDAPPPYKN